MFVWASGNYPILLTWRQIGSPEEAAAVADDVENGLHALMGSDALVKLGALTDLSGAMEYGGSCCAPRRSPPNIGSSTSSATASTMSAEGARPVRDRLVAEGITINGVALGYDKTLFAYFKRDVIGGPESFALMADDPEKLVEVMARKFVTEIVLNASANQPGADQALR